MLAFSLRSIPVPSGLVASADVAMIADEIGHNSNLKIGIASVLIQDQNGPCPMISLLNALVLAGKISVPARDRAAGTLTSTAAIDLLANYLLDNPSVQTRESPADMLQNMGRLCDFMTINPAFDSIESFKTTQPLSEDCVLMMRACGMQVYHAWLVDPQDSVMQHVLTRPVPSSPTAATAPSSPTKDQPNHWNYETLSSMLLTNHESTSTTDWTLGETEAVKDFLKHQITVYGLDMLASTIPPNQPFILFFNNHFHTCFKRTLASEAAGEFQLLALVTDQAYAETQVVWEVLTTTDGDTLLLDGEFKRVTEQREHEEPVVISEDHDYALALRLQEQFNLEDNDSASEQQRRPSQVHSQPSARTGQSRRSSGDAMDKIADKCAIM